MAEEFIPLDNPVQDPEGNLIDLGVSSTPSMLGEAAATQRAEKFNYALGEKSPGASQMYHQIAAGQEKDLRDGITVQDALDHQKFKLDYAAKIIRDKQGAPLDQQEWETIQSLSIEQAQDPDSIMEKMYAERVISDSFYTADAGPVAKAMEEAPEDTTRILDTAEIILRNTEVAKNVFEDLGQTWENTSLAGKIWDYTEGFITLKSWYNVQNAVEGMEGSSFLMGNNMRDQIQYLWTLPPSEFAKKYKAAVEDIASRNQNDAWMFATAVISYGNTDLAWNNAQALGDLGDVAGIVGGVAKSVGALTKGARAIDAAAGAVGESIATREAAGQVPTATPGTARINDPNGGMGINIREGGPTSPIDGSPANTTQQINDLNGGMGINIQKGGPTSPMPGSSARINGMPAGEPPVKKGFVRMYHGTPDESPTSGGGRWVSQSKEYAANYRGAGSKVYYVDVPEDSPYLRAGSDVSGTGLAPDYVNVELPEEFAKQMKEVPVDRSPMGVNIPVVGPTQNVKDAKASVQRVVTSIATRSDVNIPEALSAAGSPNAAPTGAFKSLRVAAMENVPNAGGEKAMMQDLLTHMPTYMDPTAIAKGSYRFTREEADRIIAKVRETVGISKRNIEETNGIERLSDSALWEAVNVARQQVKREFPYISNAISDISLNEAEHSLANVYSVNFDLKQTGGDLFRTKEQAEFNAKNMYKLSDFSIEPQGNGYFIRVTRPIDETHPNVRDALIDTANTTPSSFAGRFLGATNKVSTAQTEARVKMVHGVTRDLAEWTKILEPVVELQNGFSKASKERFLRFVTADNTRLRTDPATGKPMKGDFYRTIGEFENAWFKSFDRLPSEKEAKAYFTYLAAYDHDYIRRNLDIYRYKARQGITNFKLTASADNVKAPSFEGKFVTDTFDRRNLKGQANIAIWDKTTSGVTVLRKADLANANYTERLDKMLAGGYQVIQVASPKLRPLQDMGVGDIVEFIVTRDFENKALSFEQIPYKPGGHVAYDFREGIKQPKIQQIGARRTYFGDTAVRMTNTPAEAKLLVKNYNEARLLLKDGKLPEFRSFVAKNLPDDADDLIAQFKAGTLDIDMPFVHTSDGTRTVDDKGVVGSLGKFEDPANDPYDLMNGLGVGYSSERELGETPSVKNIGTEGNPVFGFQPTKYMDPLDTINRAGAELARSKYLNDYRTKAAEAFVEEFQDVLNVSPEVARANPVAALMNRDGLNLKHPDAQKLRAAQNMQQATIQLMGQRTPLNEWIENSKQHLYNSVYGKFGEKPAELLDVVALSRIGDPATFLRRSAFTLQLGLFNVQQLWKQSQGIVNAVAIAGPVHGMKGAGSYPFLRALYWSNGSDAMIKGVAKKASFLGWDPDDFTEMYKALRRSGMMEIGGSHSWKDDLLDPKVFQGRVGNFLSKSAVFFNEGEKMNRATAFASAFSEWRAANKFAAFDRRANDWVLRRADVMQLNMTKAGDAAWQQGVFNIPTQFFSYQLRLLEAMFGKQLTRQEKARMLLVNSAMYGIPTGMGSTLLPINDWYEDIRRDQLQRGMPDNNIAIDAMHKGMMGILGDLIAGKETNTSSVYGAGSLNFVRDAMDGDHTFLQIIGGASGSILGRVYDSTFPVINSFRSMMSNPTPGSAKILGSDVIDFMRNAKGIDNAWKAYYGLQYGKLVTKGRVDIDDVTPVDVVMSSAFGIDPQTRDDTYTAIKDMKQLSDIKKRASREAQKFMKSFAQAIEADDPKTAEEYHKRAFFEMEQAGMDMMEKSQVINDFFRDNENLFDSVNRKYLEKMAKPPENGE